MTDAAHYALVLAPKAGGNFINLGFFGSQQDAENAARAQAQSLLSGDGAVFQIHQIGDESLTVTKTTADYVDVYKNLEQSLDSQLQNIQQQLDAVRAATTQ